MAITYLTGIPRSGKSYYAVYKLYRYFVGKFPRRPKMVSFFYRLFKKWLKKENRKQFLASLYKHFGSKQKFYYVAYTNINQFDFSLSNQLKPFVYDAIYSHLDLLNAMYLDGKNDDELISYAKEHNLYNCLFVIDECQNFFSKEDKVLTWWFTYHGHLHQDIMLITQNLDLVHKAYFKIAEFFYRAIPPSNRLFSNKFRYMQFNSHSLYKTDRIGVFNVPMLQNVFKMYVSGAENNAPSVVRKYFAFALLFFLLLIFVFYYFMSTFQTEKKETVKVDQNQSVTDQSQKSLSENDKKLPEKEKLKKLEDDKDIKDELFEIRCIDMLCTYKGTDFPKPLLNKLTAKLEPEFIWFFNDGSYIQYFVMLPSDTFDFLQKDEKKEKSTKDNKNGANTSKETKLSNPMSTAFATHK